MSQPRASFNKDQEAIVQKFARLLEKVGHCSEELRQSKDGVISPVPYFEVRTSGLNLLARTAGENSIYYRELLNMDGINPGIVTGILTAAMTDYREGFMTDAKLLISAEVFADFLVQAEVLLENDYLPAAAAIIGAVLEDGLRQVCLSKGIDVKPRSGIDDLASNSLGRTSSRLFRKRRSTGKGRSGTVPLTVDLKKLKRTTWSPSMNSFNGSWRL
jgi:hypothetical protein